MKYVLILAVIVFVMRIDVWLDLIEKATNKFTDSSDISAEITPNESSSGRKLISVKDDASLKQTPKETFLALLEDFHGNPSDTIRERAMSIFNEHPTMFNQILDRELESRIFQWRELLNNNDPKAVSFMLELMNVLQGENLEMMKRFFSLWMEINMEHFIAAYSKTKDTNCSVAKLFGDSIPEEEKINEFYDRESALKEIIAKEKIEAAEKALANNCLLVLAVEISKVAPKPLPEEQAPVVDPAVSIDTAQGGVTP